MLNDFAASIPILTPILLFRKQILANNRSILYDIVFTEEFMNLHF